MNRGSFIKSLIGLIAAPKILAEIEFQSNQSAVINSTESLITDLNLLIPNYYNSCVIKYGSQDYELFKKMLGI